MEDVRHFAVSYYQGDERHCEEFAYLPEAVRRLKEVQCNSQVTEAKLELLETPPPDPTITRFMVFYLLGDEPRLEKFPFYFEAVRRCEQLVAGDEAHSIQMLEPGDTPHYSRTAAQRVKPGSVWHGYVALAVIGWIALAVLAKVLPVVWDILCYAIWRISH